MKTGVIKRTSLPTSARFDASYHLSEGETVKRTINNSPYKLISVGDAAERIFYGARARRVYVSKKDHGVPFLSSSDILLSDLSNVKYVSKKHIPSIDDMKLQKGWVLISRSGTVGNCAYTNEKYAQRLASEDIIRLVPNNILRGGFVYAYLASKYGYSLLTQGTFGAVIQHIEPNNVAGIPIPVFPDDFQTKVDDLIQESSRLREEAADLLEKAKKTLKSEANLPDLTVEDYNYFGSSYVGREVSTFGRNIQDISSVSFNAFNYSERVRKNILSRLEKIKHISLYDALDDKKLQSPMGVTVNELEEGHGIMLINQKDIFDQIVRGKWVAKKAKYYSDLLQKDEILIAKIGTLGESESFCRCIYVGEELKGKLISSAFYRFKSSALIPSGYLFAWLSSDYGFRLIRASHYGTKLCYPNPAILYKYPVPIISKQLMQEIDIMVKDAHHKYYLANNNELSAISLVEKAIKSWEK